MDRRIGERQRWVWLTAGLSAAVASCLCGLGWPWVLAGGVLVSLYYIHMDQKLQCRGLSELLQRLPEGLFGCGDLSDWQVPRS